MLILRDEIYEDSLSFVTFYALFFLGGGDEDKFYRKSINLDFSSCKVALSGATDQIKLPQTFGLHL